MDPLAVDAPSPGEPLPIELMNTVWSDREGLHDGLATDADVLTWLHRELPRLAASRDGKDSNFAFDAVQIPELGRGLRTLRDALRCLAARETDDPRTLAVGNILDATEAVRIVNEAARAAAHWSQLRWGSREELIREVETHAPFDVSISGHIAERAIDLFSSDLRLDLRACLAPGCILYFIRQHPRREWCSTSCGNRVRAARHYERLKARGDGPSADPFSLR